MTTNNLLLDILQDEALAIAQCLNVQQGPAIASMLVKRIQQRCQGEVFSIPMRSRRSRAEMKADVARRYNGTNAVELAKEYDITVRHVRRLANHAKSSRGINSA